MADFVQTMKDWMRMCEHCDRNEKIGCVVNGSVCAGFCKMKDDIDLEVVEAKVTAWAAEHPEPVYPTWEEWLVDNGVFASDDVRFHGDYRFYMNDRPMCNIPTEKIYSQIPAEIAQKLGLPPKEV